MISRSRAVRSGSLVLCFQRMTHAAPRPSLPGLTRQSILPKDVDARDKPGHDGGGGLSVGVSTLESLLTAEVDQGLEDFAFEALQQLEGDVEEIARPAGWIEDAGRAQPVVK